MLTGKENTCEVIAVYNCLCHLDYSAENEQKHHDFDMEIIHNQSIIWEEQGFPYLLYCFERHGLALGGYFGTSPMAMKRLFVKFGYHVSVIK